MKERARGEKKIIYCFYVKKCFTFPCFIQRLSCPRREKRKSCAKGIFIALS
jgi:hypothetical protein